MVTTMRITYIIATIWINNIDTSITMLYITSPQNIYDIFCCIVLINLSSELFLFPTPCGYEMHLREIIEDLDMKLFYPKTLNTSFLFSMYVLCSLNVYSLFGTCMYTIFILLHPLFHAVK